MAYDDQSLASTVWRPAGNEHKARSEQGDAMGASVENVLKVIWTETSPPGTYFLITNHEGTRKKIGQFEIPPGGHNGRIFVSVDAAGPFVVAGSSQELDADGAIAVFTRGSSTTELEYVQATPAILGAAGARIFSVSRSH